MTRAAATVQEAPEEGENEATSERIKRLRDHLCVSSDPFDVIDTLVRIYNRAVTC